MGTVGRWGVGRGAVGPAYPSQPISTPMRHLRPCVTRPTLNADYIGVSFISWRIESG
jgi:hypothetical protein